MSTMQHHAIVVVTRTLQLAERYRAKAVELMCDGVSPLVECAGYADYYSFFIAPDIHKEEAEESKCFDQRRDALLQYFDGLPSAKAPRWVEVSFGELGSRVTNADPGSLDVWICP